MHQITRRNKPRYMAVLTAFVVAAEHNLRQRRTSHSAKMSYKAEWLSSIESWAERFLAEEMDCNWEWRMLRKQTILARKEALFIDHKFLAHFRSRYRCVDEAAAQRWRLSDTQVAYQIYILS